MLDIPFPYRIPKGYTVVDDDDDDPVLLDDAGVALDTWREDFPY